MEARRGGRIRKDYVLKTHLNKYTIYLEQESTFISVRLIFSFTPPSSHYRSESENIVKATL